MSHLKKSDFPQALVDSIAEKGLTQPQAALDVVHSFGPGVYLREMRAPAGSFIIGHRHKTSHTNMLVKGRCRFLTDDGSVVELTAPLTFVAPPGQKVAYVLEDMVWINIHSTTLTDIDALEATLLDKSELPSVPEIAFFDNDYQSMLADIGMSEELVQKLSKMDDVIPFPYGSYKVRVADSSIEGKGLFATAQIEDGEVICVARLGSKRTPAGRYTNHAGQPNAMIIEYKDGNAYLIAKRAIAGSAGGYNGEEITVDYRQVLKDKLRLVK